MTGSRVQVACLFTRPDRFSLPTGSMIAANQRVKRAAGSCLGWRGGGSRHQLDVAAVLTGLGKRRQRAKRDHSEAWQGERRGGEGPRRTDVPAVRNGRHRNRRGCGIVGKNVNSRIRQRRIRRSLDRLASRGRESGRCVAPICPSRSGGRCWRWSVDCWPGGAKMAPGRPGRHPGIGQRRGAG